MAMMTAAAMLPPAATATTGALTPDVVIGIVIVLPQAAQGPLCPAN
jgi:hypothetical protein